MTGFGLHRAAQRCTGLRRTGQGCTGLPRAAGLHMAAQGCTGLHRAAQGCAGLHRAAQDWAGLHRAAQGCAGLHRAAQGWAGLHRAVQRSAAQGCAGLPSSLHAAMAQRAEVRPPVSASASKPWPRPRWASDPPRCWLSRPVQVLGSRAAGGGSSAVGQGAPSTHLVGIYISGPSGMDPRIRPASG